MQLLKRELDNPDDSDDVTDKIMRSKFLSICGTLTYISLFEAQNNPGKCVIHGRG